ncbi:YaiO family outer membrane beta-barrel protein [Salegentibacter sp. F188]|uniref:YaiO family outer membrane beta-barrel protein n=1 Tax=Autumnicola patrickiae TaxID=3075591 RepID=A0ABU3DX75_9FLAO|nr:YaiO family outer membrane beta-barrel protein [Salegentibacter sp. F188]MDT0688326.1 YaiO family outer membrane beta-barrel protein [Salegentibacter sp. F188]
MKNFLFFLVALCLTPQTVTAQQTTETNTDSLYYKALDSYKEEEFNKSLRLTNQALELAPEYHDIRILQVRNYWALGDLNKADDDLELLLKEAPQYVDTKPLALQRIGKFTDKEKALNFVNRLEEIYPNDTSIKIQKAQLLLKLKRRKEAREIAFQSIEDTGISGPDRYVLQIILNRTVSNEIAFNYQLNNFSEDYNRESWHTISAEFQHNLNRTAVIGRVNYTDRAYDQGTLYELEAYPVINDRMYGFINAGFSDGTLFPNYRGSASLFYNFAQIFEAEVGGRLLGFDNSSFFTGILGLTAYQGSFYLNARTFIGPERLNQLVQNYQFNIRYYFGNADNFFFGRLGSGISPDEGVIYTSVQNNPGLEAYYFNIGINKSLGIHHIIQLGGGYLYEDVNAETKGNQFLANVMYRYRF